MKYNDKHLGLKIDWDRDGTFETWAKNEIPEGLVPDLREFFLVQEFITVNSSFDTLSAIGDQNRDGIADESDIIIYALIEDLNAYTNVANESLFSPNSLFTTDATGHVPILPGIAFFTDRDHRLPYTDNQLLVVSTDQVYLVSTPQTVSLFCLGLIGLGLARWKKGSGHLL